MIEEDKEREERITDEIIVDAYGPEEQAMSWHVHLEDKLVFPFKARCIKHKKSSPLKVGDLVKVTAMADQEDCMHTMLVMIRFRGLDFAAPLSQLEPITEDTATMEAIKDWHYWRARGYSF